MGEIEMSCIIAEEAIKLIKTEYFVLGLIIGFVAGWIAKKISEK
jgi:hypothetical protein